MQALQDLEDNEDWGDLKGYDVTITQAKEGGKTSYTVTPSPTKDLNLEAKQAWDSNTLDLSKLFAGEYPDAKATETEADEVDEEGNAF